MIKWSFRISFPSSIASYSKKGKFNQGNQDSSGNKKSVIQGQKPEMENRHTQH